MRVILVENKLYVSILPLLLGASQKVGLFHATVAPHSPADVLKAPGVVLSDCRPAHGSPHHPGSADDVLALSELHFALHLFASLEKSSWKVLTSFVAACLSFFQPCFPLARANASWESPHNLNECTSSVLRQTTFTVAQEAMPANDDFYFPGKRRLGFQVRFHLESLCLSLSNTFKKKAALCHRAAGRTWSQTP